MSLDGSVTVGTSHPKTTITCCICIPAYCTCNISKKIKNKYLQFLMRAHEKYKHNESNSIGGQMTGGGGAHAEQQEASQIVNP